jgi:hypothetical protein
MRRLQRKLDIFKVTKLYNSKKGLELSINFIVMLIIALVVFGMGIKLFTMFFIEAENIKQDLDDQTKKELQAKMMSSPDQVVIYPTSLTIQKGKANLVGVGILNIGGGSTYFTLNSTYQNCYDRDGTPMTSVNCGSHIGLIEERNITILLNTREVTSVPVRVDRQAASGKYSILITVTQDETEIGKNLVYINVP